VCQPLRPFPTSRLLRRGARLVGYRLLAFDTAAADVHEAATRADIPAPAPRVVERARSGRDQPADDHVLLQAAQVVLQAADRRFRQHAGRLLERSRRYERLRRQRRLGDAQQHRLQSRRNLALLLDALVHVRDPGTIQLLAAQQRGVAGVGDFDLPQHLANDHLDVLVVDLHALQPVHVLDLAHQVVGQRLDALQTQDVVRVRLAVRDHFAALHVLAFEDVEVAPLRNQLFVLLALLIGDDQAALALRFLAERHRAGVLREDRRVLRLAGLEQIRDARQTAGDVASLRGLLRDTRDDVADGHFRAVLQAHDRARGQRVHGRNVGVREGDFLALGIRQAHDRTQILAAAGALLRIHHDRARQARDLVDLALHRQAFDEVLELDEARHFGHDRVGVRVPGRHDLARADRIAVADGDDRAVRDLVA